MVPSPHSNKNRTIQEGSIHVRKPKQLHSRSTRLFHAASAAAEQRRFQRIQRDSLFNPRRTCPWPARNRVSQAAESVTKKRVLNIIGAMFLDRAWLCLSGCFFVSFSQLFSIFHLFFTIFSRFKLENMFFSGMP